MGYLVVWETMLNFVTTFDRYLTTELTKSLFETHIFKKIIVIELIFIKGGFKILWLLLSIGMIH